MVLDQQIKKLAIRYVAETGFFKNRLAAYLTVSRPTLDKVLEENPDFFTELKAADALYCKELINLVKKKNPIFLLKTRYREEFNDDFRLGFYDPEEELKKILKLIKESSNNEHKIETPSTV